MSRSAFFALAVACLCGVAEARGPAPSKITVTVSGLEVVPWVTNHNGTWDLYPVSTPDTGMWVYGYVDNATYPRIVWGLTIDTNNQIYAQAYPGQFHPTWGVLGDVYSIGGANQINGGVAFLQISASP